MSDNTEKPTILVQLEGCRKELNMIRTLIKADENESTFDEVERRIAVLTKQRDQLLDIAIKYFAGVLALNSIEALKAPGHVVLYLDQALDELLAKKVGNPKPQEQYEADIQVIKAAKAHQAEMGGSL